MSIRRSAHDCFGGDAAAASRSRLNSELLTEAL
jgi:hypothetical protein